MCGRYYIEEEDQTEELARIIEEINRRSQAAVKTGEVFPGDAAPVLANNRRGEKASFAMRWGYALNKGTVINARSETAREKPLFRDGMLSRRCLIPASHYFEWAKEGTARTKYALAPGAAAPSGFFTMAGLYRIEPDAQSASFVVLTRPAGAGIAFIHDRMPAIVPENLRAAWLDPRADAREILAACQDDMTYAIA